jgi:ATP-dependent Clp protease ATP-binding subunit ClpC
MKKAAITAYKDKITNQMQVYNNYAVVLDPSFEPFVVTQFDIFTVALEKLEEEIRYHKARDLFTRFKRIIATSILILAVPMGALYVMNLFGMVISGLPALFIVFAKETVYLAALAILVLWHDLSTTYDAQKLLPRYPILDDFVAESISQNTMQFSHFKLKDPLDFFHPMTKKIFYESVVVSREGFECNTQKLLQFVVRHEHTQRILKRLEIDDAGAALLQVPITDDSAPTFPFMAMQSFLLYAMEQAIATKSFQVYPEHILLAMFHMFPVLKDVLRQYEVDMTTFEKIIEWYIITEQFKGRTNFLNLKQPYYQKGGIVDSWVKGFTFYLDKISSNITETISERGGLYGIGHTKEINYLMSILQKSYDANTILVGDPGVGKSSIIWGLAQKIIEGDVPPSLRGLIIKTIDINRFLSVGNELGGVSALIEKLSVELKNQVGTILYFDELEVLVTTGTGQGSTISYLLPLLMQSPVPIIGTMTYSQYNDFEKQYPSILQSFSVIRVDEVSAEDTYSILATKVQDYEQNYNTFVSFPALGEILKMTQIYMPNKRFPKKAIEVLDQAVILASRKPEKKLTRDIVRETIAEITKIPTVAGSQGSAHTLLNLEDKIHEKYVNQNSAVKAIVEALQRSQTMLRNTQRPISVFMFLGPTGVGKTELAKITAREYFGGDYSVIRVDLSQFKSAADMPSIMAILEKVTIRPYSLLLLDEIEKAPQFILDMFMRLFDEGIIVTDKGENLYFNNSIIICTSNIGSDLLLHAPQEQYEQAKEAVINMLPEYFRPEFINRFDRTIIFEPLTREHIIEICIINLNELVQKLLSQGITAEYSEKTINFLADIGYNPGMGVRPLKRAIQDYIEANIARYMLEVQAYTGNHPDYVNIDTIIDTMTNSPDNQDNNLIN